MYRLLLIILLAAALSPVRLGAFTYNDGDLLLIFRKPGHDDLLFNLGSVNQVLGQPDGTEVSLSNWNLALVQSRYALNDGALVTLLATTSREAATRRAWLTSAAADSAPVRDRSISQWVGIFGLINAAGTKAQEATAGEATNAYAISPSQPSAYSFIASGRGSSPGDIPYLGGTSTFRVESLIPAQLRFFEVKPSSLNPKPDSPLLGTFRLGADGVLVFRAGPDAVTPPAPTQITGIVVGLSGPEVTFDTVVGTSYRLRYSAQLAAATDNWTTGPDSVAGTGTPATLVDATATDTTRFYWVESFH